MTTFNSRTGSPARSTAETSEITQVLDVLAPQLEAMFEAFVTATLDTYKAQFPGVDLSGSVEKETLIGMTLGGFIHGFLGHYIEPHSFESAANALGESFQQASLCVTATILRGDGETRQ